MQNIVLDTNCLIMSLSSKNDYRMIWKAFLDGEYDLYIDDGLLPRGTIDTAKELVVLAMVNGIIERRGAYYYYDGSQLAQGQENTIEVIRNDQELFLEIVGKL